MLIKEQVKSIESPLPGSFAALMEMHEINYTKLLLLFGDIRSLQDEQVLSVPGHLPLKVVIKERCRHTTVMMLTYCFSGNNQEALAQTRPDLLIRVYHDACQVEVINHRHRFRQCLRHQKGSLALSWYMNRFLYKWLGYLHYHGYSICG